MLFICNTPLHVLLSSIVISENKNRVNTTLVALEYSNGVQNFAKMLFKDEAVKLIFLPGRANAKNTWHRTLIQKNNAKILSSTLSQKPDTIFIYHDLLPETQALLNKKNNSQTFIMIEDGVALYGPRGTIKSSILQKIIHKTIFGWKWNHAHALGLHPSISEIKCLFPQLAHKDIINKKITSLSHAYPRRLLENLPASKELDSCDSIIAVLPFMTEIKDSTVVHFLTQCIKLSKKTSKPLFLKTHPRDPCLPIYLQNNFEQFKILPQSLPIESLLLASKRSHTIIGWRTSSLHVIRALCPHVNCLYYEEDGLNSSKKWLDFMNSLSIERLTV